MASVPTDQERLREASPSELLRSLLADIRLMLQREAELAKLEVKDKGSRLLPEGSWPARSWSHCSPWAR